jgi:hypothetical protein
MVKVKNLFRLKDGLDPVLKMQTLNYINLFMASFNIKYAIYIVELEALKASRGKGSFVVGYRTLQRQYLLEGTRMENKRLTTPVHCEQ